MKFILVFVLLAVAVVGLLMLRSPTGNVISNTDGEVSVLVQEELSIILPDGSINFGTCEPNTEQGYSIWDSSQNSLYADNADCNLSSSFPDKMVVENNGNMYATIRVSSDTLSTALFSLSDSWYAYKSVNATTRGGCVGAQTTYTNFTSTDPVTFLVCSNLSYVDTNDRVNVYIMAWANASGSGGGSPTLKFIGSPAS